MTCPHPLLTELVLGALSSDEAAEATGHSRDCEHCRLELSEISENLTWIASALPAEAETPGLSRLLASVTHLERFSQHRAALAELFDIGLEQARHRLHDFSVDDGWEPATIPGVTWKQVPLGPRLPRARGTLARIEPGATFPLHEHLGEERVLVLQGGLFDDGEGAGSRRARQLITEGEVGIREGGSRHAIEAAATVACYCALVNIDGIVFR